MNKTNKSAIVLIFLMGIMLFSLVSVSAMDAEQNVSKLTIFWNNLMHSNTQFSIVGTNRICGIDGQTPNYEWAVQSGQNFMTGALDTSLGLANNRPSSLPSNAIIDIFTNGWTPFVEVKNFLTWGSCGASSGPCVIQVYTCPQAECTSDSNCASGTCNSVSCTDTTTRSGQTVYFCPGENLIPYQYNHYSYCNYEDYQRCYYKIAGESTCNYRDYPGETDCADVNGGYYSGYKLYNSKSTCDASQTCKTEGQSCGYSADAPLCCGSLTCQNFGCYPPSTECSGTQTRACTITNGAGTQTCNANSGTYAACLVTSCNSGYTEQNNACVLPVDAPTPFAISMTYADWKDSTAKTRLSTGCSVKENCLPYEDLTGSNLNYSVTCKGSAVLVNQLKEDAKTECSVWEQYSFTWLAGIAACSGSVAFAFITAVPSVGVSLGVPIVVCAASGAIAVTATATEKAAALVCSGIKSNQINGACIATPVYQSGSVCSFLQTFNWFSLVQDPCLNGGIILAILILIGAVVVSKI